MKKIDLAPNTPDWLEFRKSKIGASDAPVIMEVSPWKTPYQLWQQKLDLSHPDFITRSMQRGVELEQQAREELERITGLLFSPCVVMHAQMGWMISSLDGLDLEENHIAEIKCPNAIDHAMAEAGKVPEKYYPQLQHQLEVCEMDMVHYFSFDGEKGVLVKVYRDEDYIKKMIQKEREFWECLQELTPPPFTCRDYKIVESEDWKKAAQEYIQIDDTINELERKKKEIRDALINLSNHQNSVGEGIKVLKTFVKGRIEYNDIPEIKKINLDDFRRPPSEVWKILKV